MSCNHVIGLASIVGVVLLTFFLRVNGGADKFYENLYDFYQQQNQLQEDDDNRYKLPPKSEVIDNIGYLAKQIFCYCFILQQNGENISCKVGRLLSGFDSRYWDVWEGWFTTFEVNKNGTVIVFPNSAHKGSMLTFQGSSWKTTIKFPLLIKKRKVWMKQFEF